MPFSGAELSFVTSMAWRLEAARAARVRCILAHEVAPAADRPALPPCCVMPADDDDDADLDDDERQRLRLLWQAFWKEVEARPIWEVPMGRDLES